MTLEDAPATVWPGVLWEPSLPEGSARCEVALRPEALVARLADGREVALPLATLAFERQGHDAATYGFHPLDAPQPLLTTRDPGLLGALRAHPLGRALLERERSARHRAGLRTTAVPVALVVLVLAALAWAVLAWLPALALRATPLSVDARVGQLALPATLAQLGGREVQDARVVAPVRALLAPLAAQVRDAQGARFEVHVVAHEQPNAFALPGGPVVVTTGLLLAAPSAEAVAGVLAHEVSHVTGRHAMRAVLRRASVGVLLALAFGDAAGASGALVDQAAALVDLSYSRDMEREADRDGVALLARAGVDPRGLAAFLRALAREEAKAGARVPAFLSTHPVTAERLAALEQLTARARPARAPGVDFGALQAAARERQAAR